MKDKPDLQNIGNAGEYFIASILSAHGFTTTITLGRAEVYDIIAISPKGKTIKIQVKASWYTKNNWRLNEKNENVYSEDFFYAFVQMNELKAPIQYWIIPSKFVANVIKKRHELWLNTPGKKSQKHNDNPGRTFPVKKDNYIPDNFDWSIIENGDNSLNPLFEFDKKTEIK